MKTVLIDWSTISNLEGFYASVFRQTDAPSWHGHNLNAIRDSWVTGHICSSGPPFDFVFRHNRDVSPSLSELMNAVCEIAEDSVKENGGKVTYES